MLTRCLVTHHLYYHVISDTNMHAQIKLVIGDITLVYYMSHLIVQCILCMAKKLSEFRVRSASNCFIKGLEGTIISLVAGTKKTSPDNAGLSDSTVNTLHVPN